MAQHLLFLTGRLAEPSLRRVLGEMEPLEFTWEVRQLGVKVAALMTVDTIIRRLADTGGADRVVIPGRCTGEIERLDTHFGTPFERGPDELRDLPEWFGRGGRKPDLSAYDVLIFAEIVDAPRLDVEQIVTRARDYRGDGADVIDLGCLPGVPFPHLADAVDALKAEGLRVSVDSLATDDLLAGARAGADYLLSLTEETLWVADEVAAVPVLIPAETGDLDGLCRAWEALHARGREALVDSILDPIHFGFADSLLRYQRLRERLPEAPIMMGIGNLTELTEADTNGINALLMGFISELGIGAVLTTQVSPHCRSAVREADLARRIMFRARAEQSLPKQLHGGLAQLHERTPFPYSTDEIRAAAAEVHDRNFRVQVSADGIHLFNRELFASARDPFALYPRLEAALAGDSGHAFYLGIELARAEIAWQLGKRYTQDQPLRWGAALPEPDEDRGALAVPGPTKRR